MKAKRKVINISIEYGDRSEVEKAFNVIYNHLKTGKTAYEREKIGTAIFEFFIENVEPLEYEEREINGKLCFVFQSLMNKELKSNKHKIK